MALIEKEERMLFVFRCDQETERHNSWLIKYLTKVANKENFLKTLDPPESISNSELHKQKEGLITNTNRIQRFAFFLVKTVTRFLGWRIKWHHSTKHGQPRWTVSFGCARPWTFYRRNNPKIKKEPQPFSAKTTQYSKNEFSFLCKTFQNTWS